MTVSFLSMIALINAILLGVFGVGILVSGKGKGKAYDECVYETGKFMVVMAIIFFLLSQA